MKNKIDKVIFADRPYTDSYIFDCIIYLTIRGTKLVQTIDLHKDEIIHLWKKDMFTTRTKLEFNIEKYIKKCIKHKVEFVSKRYEINYFKQDFHKSYKIFIQTEKLQINY